MIRYLSSRALSVAGAQCLLHGAFDEDGDEVPYARRAKLSQRRDNELIDLLARVSGLDEPIEQVGNPSIGLL
jgi:hypothetical protein